MSLWSSLALQDAASPLMAQLTYFHDHALVILVLIMTLVFYWMLMTFLNKYTNRHLLEHQTVEVIWTVLPMFVLIFIALPSLRMWYLLDEINEPDLTVKVSGNQWYGSYEYTDFPTMNLDSYMVSPEDTKESLPRLLEVDNRLTLPFGAQLRFLVTASDVIHSWTIPVLGVKADAVPGRLNQISTKMDRPGVFYGQCSEICGANHSFMPIVLESVLPKSFLKLI
uniref:Cytochrome c oxidase subunit 2 n=1 Tax=Janira maculosa TaxID=155701 RepID=E3SXB0_9CRUS|nr:cytochrome c oxidase subunit II [Janira maculosa]